MYCPNCGTLIGEGVNFCPNCGAQLKAVVQPTVVATSAVEGNMVMVTSLGTCSQVTAAALFQQVCGYSAEEAALLAVNVPITVARKLTDSQARYLAQAFTEYGMEVSVYDRNGWRDLESETTSVWDKAGMLIAGVASALGLLNVNNRITRDMIRRMDYPYQFVGARPPRYRLNTRLVQQIPPRRPAPIPRPAPRPAPVPPRPVQPVRPVPQPAPVPRPATPPKQVGPVARPVPVPKPTTGGVNPGPNVPGMPGRGAGRQGGPKGPGMR